MAALNLIAAANITNPKTNLRTVDTNSVSGVANSIDIEL